MPVPLERTDGPARVAQIVACDYRGEGRFHREIVFSGELLDFGAVGKEHVMARIIARVAEICDESPKRARRAALPRLVTTAPGAGDGIERLAHLVYSWSAGTGAGGMFQIRTRTYALFDDGLALRGVSVPLPDFDVDASRRHDPGSWTRWRRAEGGFELERTQDGKTGWAAIGGTVRELAPAPRGTRYDGRYTWHHTTGNAFTGASVSSGSYTFRPDGTYATSKFRMSESIGQGSTINAVRTEGPDGCSSATSLQGGVVGGTASRTDCGDGRAGTYEIEGYTITLRANNGTNSRFPFFPTGAKSFILHGREHVRQKRSN